MCWALKKLGYRFAQKALKIAMCFMDWSEPELLEGEGAVLELPAFIKNKGINKVLIVTDKGLMNLHLLDPLFEELKKTGIEYVIYDGVEPCVFSKMMVNLDKRAMEKVAWKDQPP